MANQVALPLEGLYLHLVRAGFALSVRDFEAMLNALRLGHGVGSRDRLAWLCRTLWARGEEEGVRLQALFDRFMPPDDDLVRKLSGRSDDAAIEPLPARPGQTVEPSDDVAAEADAAAAAAAPQLDFGAAGGTGEALPGVRHQRAPLRDYVFEPRPPIAPRLLALAWRRYRRARRHGARTELDIEATIAEQCRTGVLSGPVLVAPRRNQARLLVLIDASASMLPWRALGRLVAESLPQGRLAEVRLAYFDNDPAAGVFDTAKLTGGARLADMLEGQPDKAILIISDAGAARGRLDRERVTATRSLFSSMRPHCVAMAWLNPMPRERWKGSSAARIARDPACAMHAFDEDGLVRAIDHLRGSA